MEKYHKIDTVYHRDPDNYFKTLLEGTWSRDEFKMLKDIEWVWSEKIDGTNIRVMWEGKIVKYGGKTNNSEIPTKLLVSLQNLFIEEKMKKVFPLQHTTLNEKMKICLYGEGYGASIQKAGKNYLPDSTSFILFDIKIGNWWLKRKDIEGLAKKLDIKIVPIIGYGNLRQAIEHCKKGFKSLVAHNKEFDAEGLILKPIIELYDRGGRRIISKIKYKDFNH